MSWGGVDLIQRRPGESNQSAIDRLYGPDDELLPFNADVGALYETWESEQRSTVSESQLRWRDQIAAMLEDLQAGWLMTSIPDEDAPVSANVLGLEHPQLAMAVKIGAFWVNLHSPVRRPAAPNEDDLWWRLVERLAAQGCLVFIPDGGDVIEREDFRSFGFVG